MIDRVFSRPPSPQPDHPQATPGDRPVRSLRIELLLQATVVTLALAALSGCAIATTDVAKAAKPVSGFTINGTVHGGQQPISGAVIQLYAASSNGYGASSTPLLTSPVISTANGSFSITGTYTCPSGSLVYLTATGGNPGLTPGTNNANLAMMAALGACSSLNATTNIQINELTTVGSVWPLARFMSGYGALGSSPTNAAGLSAAFTAVNKVVNFGTGAVPGTTLPAGATLPTTEINTLADILATCINSAGGVAGDNTLCGQLFTAATAPGGTAPTDTVGAAINIARNPGNNLAALFNLSSPSAPFQPTLATRPDNFLIGINYIGGGLNAPKSVALDASGNVWAANSGNASLTELSNNGTALSPAGGFVGGGLNVPSSLAFDPSGNLWIANQVGNSVSKFGATGTPVSITAFTGGGLNAPSSISVDGSGNVWVTNAGNNSVTELNSVGTAVSPATGYTGAGLSTPAGIAVNPH